jgi:glyoxylase-like metal-dependent hydrolase (beta-lactamase superfamily II)
MAQNVDVIEAGGLRMHIFLSKPVIFRVASVVLEGEREVALVDAQFSADNAERVVELIRSTGKPLKTIFISYSDPDYYFGLGHIASAFPEAKVLATPQTVWMINATKNDKMAVWAPQLGDNAPAEIVVPEAVAGDYFMVDGHRVEIRRAPGDEQHAYLWIPSSRTVLGGVYLDDNEHLWVADSPAPKDREKWLAALRDMEDLAPAHVIPAHFAPPVGTNPILFTRDYLMKLEDALGSSKSGAEVVAKMRQAYPNLAGGQNLDMTAQVLKGEIPWKTTRAFPAIGRKVRVDFGGEYVFVLDFHNEHSMTFTGLVQRAGGRPMTDTVEYTAAEVAPQTYMVYWTETDNTHVVHVQNYESGAVWTNIVAPDGSFTNLGGTLKLME